jgi:hypothetical protein
MRGAELRPSYFSGRRLSPTWAGSTVTSPSHAGRIVPRALRPFNLNGFKLLTTKENAMPKGLKRKLVILSVLVAAFAAVWSASASHARGGVFCLDDGIAAVGCYAVVCCNEWGGCWCQN